MAGNKVSPFVATYTSFSGADLVVSFANNVIGELQQISWAIQREKVPVFTLGSPNPRSFSRGKRGIAGSLVIATFDHDALMKCIKDIWDQIAPDNMFTAAGNSAKGKSEDFSAALDLLKWNAAAQKAGTTDAPSGVDLNALKTAMDTAIAAYNASPSAALKTAMDTATAAYNAAIVSGARNTYASGAGEFGTAYNSNTPANMQVNVQGGIVVPPGFTTITKANLQYADQCPPFDVSLTFANEYGQAAFMKIYDLELLNEASGVSVDSVVMEKNYTWVARNLSPLYRGIYTRDSSGSIINVDTAGNPITNNT